MLDKRIKDRSLVYKIIIKIKTGIAIGLETEIGTEAEIRIATEIGIETGIRKGSDTE